MNKDKRAERRHHLERMKDKACKVFHWHDRDTAIKYANHLKICSCPMCGNPRRNGWDNGTTRQEQFAELKYVEDIKEDN